MELTTQGFVLFAHIALVIVGLGLAAIMHTALVMMRAADDVADLRQWPRIIERVEPLLPVTAVFILGTGVWLVHLGGQYVDWADGWIVAAIVGVVAAEMAGASVGPRSSALRQAIRDSEPGEISPELRSRLLDPRLWFMAHGATADFMAILFLMVIMPTSVWAAFAVLAGVTAVGVASAVPFLRPRHATPVPAQRRSDEVPTWTKQPS